jgi:integrase
MDTRLRTPAEPAQKRAMGSGTIEERGGRFRVRLRAQGRRANLGTYSTLPEAESVLQAAIEELDGTPSTISLRTWAERWLEQRELSGAVRSARDDRSRLNAHVLSESWADDSLDSITSKQLRTWLQSMLTRRARFHDGRGGTREKAHTVSRHTIAHAFATLRVCLRDAVEAGHIDENPARGVRVPKARSTSEPWKYLTPDELYALLNCEEIPEPIRLLFQLAIYTGLRKGELWGLRWGDVYLDHVTPHIVVRRSHKDAPKNGKHRTVPLLPPAIGAVKRLAALAKDRTEAALVFPARTGGMRSKWDDARWAERRELAGIKRAVRFHDMRHTCASHLLMGTWGRVWRLEEVRDMLGHSDVGVTQRYAHLAPDRLHAAAAETGTGPTMAPASFRRVRKAAKRLSHLRDSDPRPTVYESDSPANDPVSLDADGATLGPANAAKRVLQLAATGALTASAAHALAGAVLERPDVVLAVQVSEASAGQLVVLTVALAEMVLDESTARRGRAESEATG